MKSTFCDGCGSKIESDAENKRYSGSRNLHVHIGDYQVSISVSKENYIIDLCQKCLVEVVSFCILETDPYVSRTEDATIEAMLNARRIAEKRHRYSPLADKGES